MTRARGPASREPGQVPGQVPGPPADERATTVLPPVRPRARRRAPAVPEVPAIADLAAPGRPDVDAVVAAEAPEAPPARARPRPSRRMRARADEMARVLAPAGGRSRRGLSSVPAAAAVMAAVAVGGVGIALGLDAQRTGQQIALPEVPEVPAEQTPADTGPVTGGATAPTAGTSLLDAADDGATARRTTGAAPSSAAAPRTARGASATTARPRPTTSTRADDPAPSTPRSTTSTRSSTRPTPRADPDDGAPGARRGTGFDGLDGLGTSSTASDGDEAGAG